MMNREAFVQKDESLKPFQNIGNFSFAKHL